MHDLDSYLMRCYQLLLGTANAPSRSETDELCACAALVKRADQTN